MTSWFFIEMAAKSALICSIALLLAMALRNRAAADRATVLRVGIGLLVALPLIDLAFPVLQIEAFAAPALPAIAQAQLSPAEMEQLLAYAATLPPPEPTIWDDPTPLILVLWAAGALLVALRLAVGLVTLSRWTRGAEEVTDSFWLDALERARVATGASDRLKLMVTDKVPGPLGWGWRNPVILIDFDTYAEHDEADAILAHEVAHIARRDWPALILTRISTALFWFNPLTWTLAREAIQQAEEAADAHAARTVEPTRYAETLLSWGQIGRGIALPANSIAPGGRGLSRRVRAVLDASLMERSARSRIAVVAALLCVGVAGPVAALELVEAARPEAAPAPNAAPAPAPAPFAAVSAQPAPAAPPAAPQARMPRPAVAPEAPEAADVPEVDIGPALEELRRVPHTVAEALNRVRPDEIARAVRHAEHARLSSEEVRAIIARARATMPDQAALHARLRALDPAVLEAQIRRSMPSRAELSRQINASIRASRSGMEAGARGMEHGADQMEAQARRFRDRQERERIIAEQRERGRTVTHEDLLRAAEGMEQGAQRMREGAREMRENLRGEDH